MTQNDIPRGFTVSLPNALNDFFISNIDKIHSALMERATQLDFDLTNITDDHAFTPQGVLQFTGHKVEGIAKKLCSKSCELDQLPATVLMKCLPKILPTLTSIINISLMDGIRLNALKVAAGQS